MIPEGIAVYGPGKVKAKAGQEIPKHLLKGAEGLVSKAGEKFANRKSKADSKKAEILAAKKKVAVKKETPGENSVSGGANSAQAQGAGSK